MTGTLGHTTAGTAAARGWKPSLFPLLLILVAVVLRLPLVFDYIQPDENHILGDVIKFLKDKTIIPNQFWYAGFFSYLSTVPTAFAAIAFGFLVPGSGPADALLLRLFDSFFPFLPARVLSLAFGILTVWLVYRIGNRYFGYRAAQFSAGLLAVAALHVERSAMGVPDATTAFFGAWTLWFTLAAEEESRASNWLWAGFLGGVCVAAKYNAVFVLAAPLALALSQGRIEGSWRIRESLKSMALVAGASVVGFLVAAPGWLFRAPLFLEALLSLRNIVREGHIGWYGLDYFKWLGVFWELEGPTAVAFLAGALFALFLPSRKRITVVAAPLLAYAVIGGSVGGIRWFSPVYPHLCLLGGILLGRVYHFIRGSQGLTAAATIAFAALAVVPLTEGVLRAWKVAAVRDNRDEARRWIFEHIPVNAMVAVDPAYVPRLLSATEAEQARMSQFVSDYFLRRLNVTPLYRTQSIPEGVDKPRIQAFLYPTDPGRVDADFMVLSSWWYERYASDLPEASNKAYLEHVRGRAFYRMLIDSPERYGWQLIQTFGGERGPVVSVFRSSRSVNAVEGSDRFREVGNK
jgi:hypothetical protein